MSQNNRSGRDTNRLPEVEIPNIFRLSTAYRAMKAWEDTVLLIQGSQKFATSRDDLVRIRKDYLAAVQAWAESMAEYQRVGGRLN